MITVEVIRHGMSSTWSLLGIPREGRSYIGSPVNKLDNNTVDVLYIGTWGL